MPTCRGWDCRAGRSRCCRTTSPAARRSFGGARRTFITLEGGEGAGKTTQARLLAAALAERGIAVLATREPGGAPGAERLRQLLLAGQGFSPLAETLLHFAARAEHVAVTLRPALATGTTIVCDRFSDSTMAYQGYGQGADRGQIAALAGMLGLTPDLTFVLDIDPATASARMAGRGRAPDRYEAEDAAFHARVAGGFRAIAAADMGRCVLVPAGGAVQAVHAALLAAVLARRGTHAGGPPDA